MAHPAQYIYKVGRQCQMLIYTLMLNCEYVMLVIERTASLPFTAISLSLLSGYNCCNETDKQTTHLPAISHGLIHLSAISKMHLIYQRAVRSSSQGALSDNSS